MADAKVAFPLSLSRRISGDKTSKKSPSDADPAPSEDSQRRKGWLLYLKDVTPFEWDILLVSTVMKLLLFPA